MSGFQLSKWYLDCVTDSGDTSIVYVGSVAWRNFQLRYSSILESSGDRVSVGHSVRDQTEPNVCGRLISWPGNSFGVHASWQADSKELHETILSTDRGMIDWHCLMPRACVQFGARCGLGYAERLVMTAPPWEIPIQELFWGRFESASDWIVWIDCQGELSRRIVFRNGERTQTLAIEDGRILFADGSQLCMDRSLVLRQGSLGTTALRSIPGLNRLPVRLLRVHERKWRSAGKLLAPGGVEVQGWVIHERVSWPK